MDDSPAAADSAPETIPEPTPEAAPLSEHERQQQELEQLRAERDQNLDRWQRTAAEFDNYRKRQQKEQDIERQYRALPVVSDLLPVLDDLQRAIEAATKAPNAEQLLQGVQMAAQKFVDTLARHQVLPIVAEGQPFDPNKHLAITQMPSAAHPPMTVLHDVERGYTLHDRVLRPTKVIVSTAPPSA